MKSGGGGAMVKGFHILLELADERFIFFLSSQMGELGESWPKLARFKSPKRNTTQDGSERQQSSHSP